MCAEEQPTRERPIYDLDALRNWAEVTGGVEPPLRLAVFGDPVAHSASPPMHNAVLAALNLPMRYTRIAVRAEELEEALGLIAARGFVGVNLTIPHKAAALALLDEIDPHAARLGVVNTVRVEPDARLRGFNTDGPGFVRAVQEAFGVSLKGKRVLILGAAGGAGQALAAQCLLERCERLVLVNRTFEKSQRLAENLRVRFPEEIADVQLEVVEWDRATSRSSLAEMDLVVNTTPIGLKAGDISPLAPESLPANVLVFDTVYRAAGTPTPLVRAAREAGAQATGGLSLLLHQGVLAFEHWFRQPAPVEVMRRALEG